MQAESETQTSDERDEAGGGWGMLEPLLGEPSIIRNLLRACPHSYMLRRDAISLIAGAMMGQENAWRDKKSCVICGKAWGGAVRPCAFACEHAHVACVRCVANSVTKGCTTKSGGVVEGVWSQEQEDEWMDHEGVESRSCELQRVMPCCVCELGAAWRKHPPDGRVVREAARMFTRVQALSVHNRHPVDIGLPQLVLSQLPSGRRWNDIWERATAHRRGWVITERISDTLHAWGVDERVWWPEIAHKWAILERGNLGKAVRHGLGRSPTQELLYQVEDEHLRKLLKCHPSPRARDMIHWRARMETGRPHGI